MTKKIIFFSILIFLGVADFGYCHFTSEEEKKFVLESIPYVYGIRQTEVKDYKNRKIKVWSMDLPSNGKGQKEHVMVLIEDFLTSKGRFSYLNKEKNWWTEEVSWSTAVEFLDKNKKYKTVDALWGEGTERKIETLINKILKTKPRFYLAGRSTSVEIDLKLLEDGGSDFDKKRESKILEWFVADNEIYGLSDEIVRPEKLKIFSSVMNLPNGAEKAENKLEKKVLAVLILYTGPSGLSNGTFFAVDPALSPDNGGLILSAKANVGKNPNMKFNSKEGFEIMNDNKEFAVVGDPAIIKSTISSFLKRKPSLYEVTKKVKYKANLKSDP